MRKRNKRGFTLIEVMVGAALTALLFLISANLFQSAFRSFRKTDTRLDLSDRSAIAMRRIAQDLRSAATVTIAADGTSVSFQMPLLSSTNDTTTGEKEYIDPIQGDGTTRQYYTSGGNLYYKIGTGTPEKMAGYIASVDPEPSSSTYNQTYKTFAASSVASTSGLTIMLISRKTLSNSAEYVRMSTTIKLRNKVT